MIKLQTCLKIHQAVVVCFPALFNYGISKRELMMKKLSVMVTTLMVAVLSGAGFSQGSSAAQSDQQRQGKSGETRHQEMMTPEAMVDHLSTQLNLTEEQRMKIKPIAEDVFKQMDKVRQDSSLPEPERREKMKQIHENALSQVKPILNADQQKKLDEMMSSHSHHGNAAHSHGSEDQGSNSRPHQ